MAATGTTLTSVQNSGSTVNSSNYTFASGKLTIKGTYLAGLANGDKTFTLNFSDGSSASATVTVSGEEPTPPPANP